MPPADDTDSRRCAPIPEAACGPTDPVPSVIPSDRRLRHRSVQGSDLSPIFGCGYVLFTRQQNRGAWRAERPTRCLGTRTETRPASNRTQSVLPSPERLSRLEHDVLHRPRASRFDTTCDLSTTTVTASSLPLPRERPSSGFLSLLARQRTIDQRERRVVVFA